MRTRPARPDRRDDGALTVLQRVREALLESMNRSRWPVTVSVGLVTFSAPPTSVNEMIMVADALMYEVKTSGKNSIRTKTT